MTGSLIERTLGLLELLVSDTCGPPLQQLADRLGIPKSAVHRMLAELIRLDYVHQGDDTSHYRLNTRLAVPGFRFLVSDGMVDLVQPVFDGLARETDELVRLGVIEGDCRIWIAKSQGATSGLRYDPDMGRGAPLFYTAFGHAWLTSLSNKVTLAPVERQDVGAVRGFGSNTPRSRSKLLRHLECVRGHGYTRQIEYSTPGIAVMTAPVRHPGDGRVPGMPNMAGPSARLGEAHIYELAPLLLATAQGLSHTNQASELSH